MKKHSILLAIITLIFASLACQTIMGGGDSGSDIEIPIPSIEDSGDASSPDATEEATDSTELFTDGETDFPMPSDATNVVSIAGTLNYQTNFTIEEVMEFYRDTYGKQGYTERDSVTTVSDGVFSMIFDGDPSGKAIIIQGVDFGDGTSNVTVTLQDI